MHRTTGQRFARSQRRFDRVRKTSAQRGDASRRIAAVERRRDDEADPIYTPSAMDRMKQVAKAYAHIGDTAAGR